MHRALRSTLLLAATAAALTGQSTFTARLNARHAKQPPLVGDPLPDVSAFTADGEPFALREDRGNLAVLVFGCLT